MEGVIPLMTVMIITIEAHPAVQIGLRERGVVVSGALEAFSSWLCSVRLLALAASAPRVIALATFTAES